MKLKSRLRKAIGDGILALLTFILVVSVYMCVDRSGSRIRDWRLGPICGAVHGQVDFFTPIMTISLGSYREVMLFKNATVVRCGGTYLDFGMNGVLLFVSVAALGVIIGLVPVTGHRKPKKDEANNAMHATSEPAAGSSSHDG